MAAYLVSFLLIVIQSMIRLADANPRTDIIWRNCTSDRVQNTSVYAESYSEVLKRIQGHMYRNKFGFSSEGQPPDRIYVLAECLDDLSHDECATCFFESNGLLSGCFPSTGGRVYLDGCFIRAENYSFFQETLTPYDSKRCSDLRHDSQAFTNNARRVITQLIKKAPENKGYADGFERSHDVSVYAMATCWRTLDNNSCSACLANAALSAFECLPSAEGRSLNAGCFLRYSDYAFVNNPQIRAARDVVFNFVTYAIAMILISIAAIAVGVRMGKLGYKQLHRRQNKNNEEKEVIEIDMESSMQKRSLHFKHSTLEKATDYFNVANKLGEGGCGEVYKGALADGREIAVKRLFINRNNRSQEIYNEIDIINRAQHKNLVRLLGCSLTNQDSLLVYEFLANKSLDCILFDPEKKKELSWKRRLGIIVGMAQGLKYLHKDCQVKIIHRDIKASNVLLDLRYRPKISDFGLARLYTGKTTLGRNSIAGTLGYMAPEYLAHGRLTEKVDVYSFGILVLEIVSGARNNCFKPEDSPDTLVTTAWKHFKSATVWEIMDESMEVDDAEEIKRVVQVGLLCTQESQSSRPTMTRVIEMLTRKEADLPSPSKPPFTDETMEFSLSCRSSPLPSQSSILSKSHNGHSKPR